VAGKAVLDTYGRFKDIKVRFSGVAFPGETLVTSLWKEDNKVYLSALDRCGGARRGYVS
jgi:MaoC like domain